MIAGSYFWDVIAIILESIMYQFQRNLFNFYHCSLQLQLWLLADSFGDITTIILESIMYQFLRNLFNFYHCSSQLQLW